MGPNVGAAGWVSHICAQKLWTYVTHDFCVLKWPSEANPSPFPPSHPKTSPHLCSICGVVLIRPDLHTTLVLIKAQPGWVLLRGGRGASEPQKHGGPGCSQRRHCCSVPLTQTVGTLGPARHAGKTPPSLPHPRTHLIPPLLEVTFKRRKDGWTCRWRLRSQFSQLYRTLAHRSTDGESPLLKRAAPQKQVKWEQLPPSRRLF